MKIVITDTIFLEQEHIDRLKDLGTVQIYNDLPLSEGELISRLKDAEIAIVGWVYVTSEAIEKLTHLKMISIWGTGYDSVDIKAAESHGIAVTNVPGYAAEAVAEHVFALILSFIRKIPDADRHIKMGNFDWNKFRGFELVRKTIGIIGMGSIGSRVAEIARCFGLNVISFTAHPSKEKARKFKVRFLPLDDVLSQSDFLTIHVPLTAETEKMIGYTEFNKMKKDVVIINTSRGKVIDETALIEALKSGKIAGACLDVLAKEPPGKENPLLNFDNVILTPHIAFNTTEALRRCTDICIDNVEAFIKGTPKNVVNLNLNNK
jgi:D-3-phosphoglycerate dehydrogenase